MIESITLKDYILKNWNEKYEAENDIVKIKKKRIIEKDLNDFMADTITYIDFVKRYTDYSLDNVFFNGIVDAFCMYKSDIKPFDFELRQTNYRSKKLILVNDINNYYDDEDDGLNY